eukprot:TRINITY_DN103341_c0_g1_i1.p1 TRINITY_DN103341_c0_g1~~TRINITY_DN103341_c0_g1_i1.p1  ORF type:complete len:224 (-),score=46.69 TRINITY_DN103341_c0_g1_i1:153-749(-)
MASKRLSSSSDEVHTPPPKAKRSRKETPPKMPAMTALTCATKEELVCFIKALCTKYPAVRDDVRAFSPCLPIDQMLDEISKAAAQVARKLPYDKYGRGNHDTYAYNRVRSFLSAFAKLTTNHLKTVEKSKQQDKLEEFLEGCQEIAEELHEFSDPQHNAAKTRVLTALTKAGAKIGWTGHAEDDEDDVEESAPGAASP